MGPALAGKVKPEPGALKLVAVNPSTTINCAGPCTVVLGQRPPWMGRYLSMPLG